MSWVKLDDNWDQHVKFSDVGDLGRILWVRALTYSCRVKSNGLVPRGRIREFVSVRNTKQLEAKLIAAGLWIPCEAGYMIHDFDKYQVVTTAEQKTAAEQARLSAIRSQAGRVGGQRSAESRRSNGEATFASIGSKGPSKDESKVEPNFSRVGADARRASASGVGSGSGSPEQLRHLETISSEIARYPLFDGLDAVAVAQAQVDRMMTSGQRVEWVLVSIEECNSKHVGLGLSDRDLQSRLSGFMARSRAPRESGTQPAMRSTGPSRAVQQGAIAGSDDDAPTRVS